MVWTTTQFLPRALKSFFKKSLSECAGIGLLCFTTWAAIAIWTYHFEDISFNVVSSNPIHNAMGTTGAYMADLFLQGFGLSSYMLLLVIFIWGCLLLKSQEIILSPGRFIVLIIATILLGMVFIELDVLRSARSSNWQKIPCIGGTFSYLVLLNWSRFLHAAHMEFLRTPSIFCFFFLSIILTWYSSGLSFQLLFESMKSICTGLVWGTIRVWQGVIAFYGFIKRQPTSHTRQDSMNQETSEFFGVQENAYPETDSQDLAIICDDFYQGLNGLEQQTPTSGKALNLFDDLSVLKTALIGEDYQIPTLDLLDQTTQKISKNLTHEQLQERALQLEKVLEEFGVKGEIVKVRPGPVVTMFELKPAPGIKTARVIGLADDIARSMSALSTRIAVIPGQNVIGIELPNTERQTVYLKELLAHLEYASSRASLPLALGKDISGGPIIVDLAKTPHLLVAGTTGSGKSVSVNTMILSLLFKLTPDQCKFIMIDPKMLELSIYDGIPHLLSPVVTDPKKAVVALKWAVKEMENRYRSMSKLGVRNIDGFNAKLNEARKSGELLARRVQTGFDSETGRPIFENQNLECEPLPYIVVVVDEMADLMLVAGKEIEAAVQRLAQMARAAGIHLIMATQRPSVDVITGTIKANFPTRISFQVTSKIDSRTILGEQGAEQLLGQGDMLYMAGGGRVTRVHGPFVKDDEVERVVRFLKLQGAPTYIDNVTEDDEESLSQNNDTNNKDDVCYRQAVDLIKSEGKVSTSFIQRHLQIGYNRAARIVEQMEKEGIVSPANRTGKREILL